MLARNEIAFAKVGAVIVVLLGVAPPTVKVVPDAAAELLLKIMILAELLLIVMLPLRVLSAVPKLLMVFRPVAASN